MPMQPYSQTLALAASLAPEPQQAVLAAGCHGCAVWAPVHGEYFVRMARQLQLQLPRRHIPHLPAPQQSMLVTASQRPYKLRMSSTGDSMVTLCRSGHILTSRSGACGTMRSSHHLGLSLPPTQNSGDSASVQGGGAARSA